MAEATLADRIEDLIAPSLAAMAYDVVRVRVTGIKRRTLQIMAERQDGRNMTVDDCADISRNVSAILDVEDPIHGSYTLEVSSPGIDRPLVRPEDYDRFSGHLARIELAEPISGRRRYRGHIVGREGGLVRIALVDGEVELPLERIARAQLVLTDELLASSHPQHSD